MNTFSDKCIAVLEIIEKCGVSNKWDAYEPTNFLRFLALLSEYTIPDEFFGELFDEDSKAQAKRGLQYFSTWVSFASDGEPVLCVGNGGGNHHPKSLTAYDIYSSILLFEPIKRLAAEVLQRLNNGEPLPEMVTASPGGPVETLYKWKHLLNCLQAAGKHQELPPPPFTEEAVQIDEDGVSYQATPKSDLKIYDLRHPSIPRNQNRQVRLRLIRFSVPGNWRFMPSERCEFYIVEHTDSTKAVGAWSYPEGGYRSWADIDKELDATEAEKA